jgi:hypothetical protein
MNSAKYLSDLKEEAAKRGYVVGRTVGGHHLKITHPRIRTAIFASATPGDNKALRNTVAMMNRLLRQAQG